MDTCVLKKFCIAEYTIDNNCRCCRKFASTYSPKTVKTITKVKDINEIPINSYKCVIKTDDEKQTIKFNDEQNYNHIIFVDEQDNLVKFNKQSEDIIRMFNDTIICVYITEEKTKEYHKSPYSSEDKLKYIHIITRNLLFVVFRLNYMILNTNKGREFGNILGYQYYQTSNAETKDKIEINFDTANLFKIADKYIKEEKFFNFMFKMLDGYKAETYQNEYYSTDLLSTKGEKFLRLIKSGSCYEIDTLMNIPYGLQNSMKVKDNDTIPCIENVKVLYRPSPEFRKISLFLDVDEKFIDKIYEFNNKLKKNGSDENIIHVFRKENNVFYITAYGNMFYYQIRYDEEDKLYKPVAECYFSGLEKQLSLSFINIAGNKYFCKYGESTVDVKKYLEVYSESIEEYKQYIAEMQNKQEINKTTNDDSKINKKEQIKQQIKDLENQIKLLEKSE